MRRLILVLVVAACLVSSGKGYELSDLKNLNSFHLPDGAREKLKENGFVILPSGEGDIYEIYIQAKKGGKPVVITSDLVLHTAHALFDYALRIVEKRTLIGELERLTQGMLRESVKQLRSVRDEELRQAAGRNAAFFGVGARLLALEIPLPDKVETLVRKEIGLIDAHKGISTSPIFGYLEDYSQYVPRGHYTRNEDFRKLFKTMMWYGRMGFYLRPGQSMYPQEVDTEEEGRRLTRAALLIVSILGESEELRKCWQSVYEPTAFFVGKTDDLDFHDYQELARELYGTNPLSEAISAREALDSFIERAAELRKPRVCSTPVADTDVQRREAVGPIQGFRFMGQRFIPDSYVMQNLVYDKVINYTGKGKPFTMEYSARGPQRCFPRGLDVMASLGSDLAKRIVYDEGDGDYENYAEQLSKLKEELSSLGEETWRSNLYFIWLSSLRSLVLREDAAHPPLMRTNAWSRKELNTALGSWAELRHDTILYAKQSYTIGITAVPPRPELTKGWVEPYPRLYRGARILVEEMAKQLERLGSVPEELEAKLRVFGELCGSLETISEKELQGEALVETEYRLIWEIGHTMKGFTWFSPQLMEEITTGADEKMAIVADVHTDPNTGKVLQEAVGNPGVMYLICSIEDEAVLTKGGVFTYYEFKHPMKDRLTDERWQEMVKKGEAPELPKWVQILYP